MINLNYLHATYSSSIVHRYALTYCCGYTKMLDHLMTAGRKCVRVRSVNATK